MVDTNVAIVLWSGCWPQARAINTTFSRQACSIFREEMSPYQEITDIIVNYRLSKELL
jgi:hypothetical protein